jgi:hypothetical protein
MYLLFCLSVLVFAALCAVGAVGAFLQGSYGTASLLGVGAVVVVVVLIDGMLPQGLLRIIRRSQ